MSAYALPSPFMPPLSPSKPTRPLCPSPQQAVVKRCSNIIISVKAARLDAMGIVKAIATRGGNKGSRSGSPTGSQGAPHDDDNTTSTESLSWDCDGGSSSSPSGPPSPALPLHDDAIEFELSITHAGRNYTAMRTLNRLVKLRDELAKELKDRARPPLSRRRNSVNCRSQPPPVIVIPELPPTDPSSSGGSPSHGGSPMNTMRGSFTAMHASLRSYGPAVETWLKNLVTDILPDPESSPSLTAFLWEPLSSNSPKSSTTGSSSKSHRRLSPEHRNGSSKSFCTLDSIDE